MISFKYVWIIYPALLTIFIITSYILARTDKLRSASVRNSFVVIGAILGFSMFVLPFFKQATFHKKGDLDPDNNFIFKSDCYNIPISDLFPIETLIDYRTRPIYQTESTGVINLKDLFHYWFSVKNAGKYAIYVLKIIVVCVE